MSYLPNTDDKAVAAIEVALLLALRGTAEASMEELLRRFVDAYEVIESAAVKGNPAAARMTLDAREKRQR